ncbi:rhodanese-like domain-containing protein [Tenggerimyces flavus]|uniref:Rhodanese-like domain-containing protein n=1 Tax=Tenggerimyces flavus TaxID=1708749 RepID=A0ABV7YDE1_9ACTN|nr:rhodanese-like domain-containing protein [Tenggerimyces flavus]MBM7785959.1 rhodanese-related sulfurtransferase [Tenggerimyces flavus]
MTITMTTAPLRVPPADPEAAANYFRTKLAFHTDVSDVAAAIDAAKAMNADKGFVLLDSRNAASWEQGHVPGAIHLPRPEITKRAPELLDKDVPVVTYCWGPGCDGAMKAALALAELGFRVKEMLGGMEYWIREGLPVETAAGVARQPIDPLTAPAHP